MKKDELIKIVNITEEEFERLNYQEKQKYFNAKAKLGKLIHRSRDKNGKGISYVEKSDEIKTIEAKEGFGYINELIVKKLKGEN